MPIWPGAGVDDGCGVGGIGVRVGGRGNGVELGARTMVSAGVATARDGSAAAAGRITRMYARLPHSNNAAITTMAINTFPLKILFIASSLDYWWAGLTSLDV